MLINHKKQYLFIPISLVSGRHKNYRKFFFIYIKNLGYNHSVKKLFKFCT